MQSDQRTTPAAANPDRMVSLSAIERLPTGRFRLVLGIALAALAGLFLITAPAVRSGSDDAYWFAYQIESGSAAQTMSPRELLFIPIMKVIYFAVRATGLTERAFTVVSVANAMLAAAVVALQYFVLRRGLRLNRTTSLLGSALLVVAFGFWRFAAEVEVYPLGLFAAVGLLALALNNPRRLAAWVGMAALAAVGLLVHALTAMVAVIAIPVYLIAKTEWRRLGVYAAALVAFAVAGGFAAYQYADTGDQSITAFYSEASSAEVAFSPNLVARASIGAGQSVISSGFLFGHEPIAELVTDTAPERIIADEVYLAERIGSVPLVLMSLTFGLALLAMLAATVVAVPGLWSRRRDPVVLALVAWFVVLVVFQVLRSTGSDGPEAWLFSLPPLTMLLAAGLATATPRTVVRGVPLLAVLVVVLAVHNAAGMALLAGAEGDRNAAKAEWLLANTGPDDVVLSSDSAIFIRYVRYESDAQVRFLAEAAIAGEDLLELATDRSTVNGTVYLTSDVLEVPEYLKYRSVRAYDRLVDLAAFLRPSSIRVTTDEFGGIYRLVVP